MMNAMKRRSLVPIAAAIAALAGAAFAADNPLGRRSTAPIDGVWNGTDLERRANCSNAQNNGQRGTYAEFDVSTDDAAHVLGITQIGITGLTCTYYGNSQLSAAGRSWNGTYSCSDGKRGTFVARSILVTQDALSIHLDVRLDTTETCAIEAVIGAGRLYP